MFDLVISDHSTNEDEDKKAGQGDDVNAQTTVQDAKSRIPFMGGPEVKAVMDASFAKQRKDAYFVGIGEQLQLDTMRHGSTSDRADGTQLEFSAVELTQNCFDFMRILLAMAAMLAESTHAPVHRVANGLEWMLHDKIIGGIYYTKNGVELLQPGLPLALDAITSGTKSKADDSKGVGGYGDGMKTASNTLVSLGYSMTFTFRGFDDKDPARAMAWEWKSAVPSGFKESHLVVDISGYREETPVHCDIATMVTEVSATDPKLVELLQKAFTAALCRLPWLLFETVDDPEHRTIATAEHGSWSDSTTFKPIVDCVAPGHDIHVENSGVLLVIQGIFYPWASPGMPNTLVVTFRGRGIRDDPPEERAIFTGCKRDPHDPLVAKAIVAQFEGFMHQAFEEGDEVMRERLVKAFMPLLHGGTSLLSRSGSVGSMLQHILRHSAHCDQIREMLLYNELLPNNATVCQKEETRVLAKTAVLASDSTFENVKYLQLLIDGGQGKTKVIKIDHTKAYPGVFKFPSTEELQFEAAWEALNAAESGTNPKIMLICKALEPAVYHMSGDGRECDFLEVVHAAFPVGETVKPYDFRVGGIIVYHDTRNDDHHTIEKIYPFFSWNTTVVQLACNFYGQFMHGSECVTLALEERTTAAIFHAKKCTPITIVQGKREKANDKNVVQGKPEKANDKAVVQGKREKANDKKVVQGKRKKDDESSSSSDDDGLIKVPKRVDKPSSVKKPRPPPKEKIEDTDESEEDLPRHYETTLGGKPPSNRQTLVGHAGGSSHRHGAHAPDPGPERCTSQEFNHTYNIFMPSGEVLPLEADKIPSRLLRFQEALARVKRSMKTGRCEIYASWSPGADWDGIHYGTGVCLINIATVPQTKKMIMTMCHELAHEVSHAHDVNFANALQDNATRVVGSLLAENIARTQTN